MRKVLISLLLASAVATPALAGPRDKQDREQARAERQEARQERQQAREESRAPRQAPVERQQAERPQPRVQAAPRADVNARPGVRDFNAMRDQREAVRDQRQEARDQRLEQVQQRVDQRRDARELRQSTRPLPPVMRRPPVVSNVPRPGTQPPPRVDNRRTADIRWNGNWRHDDRYDWHKYRNRHRSLFHIGFYYDPFGWNYSPFQIGWRLWPSYYSSRYWINDPWMYRLPYAPPGTRWVRYWNDALLVDTWNGQVVDAIYNFFW